MEKSAKLWNRLAKRYAASPVKHEDDYQTKLKLTQNYLHPDAEVFEFGCGTGSTAIKHAPYVRHIHATDYSSAMIEIAKSKAAAENITNVDFECIGIDAVRKPNDSVDVVMGHNILHLLPNVEEVIGKVHAMLRPGGVFVTSTGCVADMSIALKMLFVLLLPVMRLIGIAPYVNAFSRAELDAMLTGAGFSIDHEWLPARNRAAFIVARK